MATINYWGLTSSKDTVTVDLTTDTFDTLITAIATDEGLSTEYYTVTLQRDPSIGDIVYGDSSTPLDDASIGMLDGDTVICTPNQRGSKEERQVQKLEIAAVKRTATGRPAVYDRDALPTKYVGNAVVDNANSGGLIEGRPWSSVAPFSNPTLTIGSAVTTAAVSPFAGGGNSYSFISSTNSYIQVPASADWAVGTGDFTVEWFGYQTTLAQFQRVFTVGDYPAIDFGVSIESGTFYFWSGGDADTDYSSASATTTNTWYHWAVVRSGTTLNVYRNGTLRGTAVSNTDNINDSLTPFVVGNTNTYATNAAFVGYITNFRLVKGLAVYTGNFTTPTSALTATAGANPYGGSNTQSIGSGFTKLLLVP
jgi:hypothetical protein